MSARGTRKLDWTKPGPWRDRAVRKTRALHGYRCDLCPGAINRGLIHMAARCGSVTMRAHIDCFARIELEEIGNRVARAVEHAIGARK